MRFALWLIFWLVVVLFYVGWLFFAFLLLMLRLMFSRHPQ